MAQSNLSGRSVWSLMLRVRRRTTAFQRVVHCFELLLFAPAPPVGAALPFGSGKLPWAQMLRNLPGPPLANHLSPDYDAAWQRTCIFLVNAIVQDTPHASGLADGDRFEALITCGMLPALVDCLRRVHDAPTVRKLVQVLGTICTGDDRQTEAVVQVGVLHAWRRANAMGGPQLVSDTMWLLSNVCGGTAAQVDAVLKADLMKDLSGG